MRSPTVVPVLFSLALHAGALLLLTRMHLSPRPLSSHRELTIGLTNLPTVQEASHPPEAAEASSTAGLPSPDATPTGPPATAEAISPPDVPASHPQLAPLPPPAGLADADPSELKSAKASSILPPMPAPLETPASAPEAQGGSAAEITASSAPAAPTEGPVAANESVIVAARPADIGTIPTDAGVPVARDAGRRDERGSAPAVTGSDVPPAQGADAAPAVQAAQSSPAGADHPVVSVNAEPPPAADVANGPLTAAAAGPLMAAGPMPAGVLATPAPPPEIATHDPPAELAPVAAESAAAAEAPEPDDDAALARAGAFVAGYDGGPCVFLSALKLVSGTASIEGLAAAPEPFGLFHQGFMATAGFEPAVTGQVVWKPQCPAVDFLRRLHAVRATAPLLEFDAVTVRSGASLHGTIRDPARRPLHLFAVSESGGVRDLSASLVAVGEAMRFELIGSESAVTGAVPELLVAVAGAVTPPSITTARAGQAAAFFEALGAAAARSGAPVGATAKLFLLRN